MTPIARFNAQPVHAAEAALLACCGSQRWASTLVAQRPYRFPQSLLQAAESLWLSLPEADWIQAFAQHPRIGEKKAPTQARPKFLSKMHRAALAPTATEMFLASSASEQSIALHTLDKVALALTRGNRLYEEKFGFLYIVYASGHTAPELLDLLNLRLTRTREEELQEAARQQLQITQLRMNRWLNVK